MFAEIVRRKHRCAIIVDEVTNFKVQKFADEHRIKGSIVNVASYCDMIVIAFDTYKKQDDIFERLQQEFGADFNVERRKIIVSVTKKES